MRRRIPVASTRYNLAYRQVQIYGTAWLVAAGLGLVIAYIEWHSSLEIYTQTMFLTGLIGVGCVAMFRWYRGFVRRGSAKSIKRSVRLFIRRVALKDKRVLANDDNDIESQHVIGLTRLMRGDTPAAVQYLRRAASLDRNSITIKNNLAVAEQMHGETMKACALWNENVVRDPAYAPSQFNLALSEFHERKFDIALERSLLVMQYCSDDNSARVSVLLGSIYLRLGETASAVREFEKIVDAEPTSAGNHNNLGISYYLDGQGSRGLMELYTAIRMESERALFYVNLGRIRLLEGQIARAIETFDLAQSVKGAKARVRVSHAIGLYLSGNSELALPSLEEVVHQAAHDFEMHYYLGRIYAETIDVERGSNHLVIAQKLRPENNDASVAQGAITFLRKRFDDAEYIFRQALQRDPNDAVAMNNLALCFLENNNIEDALSILQKAIDVDSNCANLFFNFACALQIKGEMLDAAEHYRSAIELDAGLVGARINLALCYMTSTAWMSAVSELQTVLSANSLLPNLHFLIGCAYQRQGLVPRAIRHWETALLTDVKNPMLHLCLGVAYYTRNNPKKAVEHFRRVLVLRDGIADDHNNLALAYLKAKDMDAGIRSFERSLSLVPGNPVTHSNLGLAYFFSKKTDEAMTEWIRVRQLDPEYALRRSDIRTATYDDSLTAFPAIQWGDYMLRSAPMVATPKLELLLSESHNPWWMDTDNENLRAAIALDAL